MNFIYQSLLEFFITGLSYTTVWLVFGIVTGKDLNAYFWRYMRKSWNENGELRGLWLRLKILRARFELWHKSLSGYKEPRHITIANPFKEPSWMQDKRQE